MLKRLALGWQGIGNVVDVYTDTAIHHTELTAQDGRDAVARVPPGELAGVVLDDERYEEPGRLKKYATRIRAAKRALACPVSAYANVQTHYYAFRDMHATDLARRGVDVAYGGRSLLARQADGPHDYSGFAREPILAASDWAVFHAYLIDDVSAPWHDVAIVWQGAAACRALAPRKPACVYISPEIYRSSDFAPLGVCTIERWVPLVSACLAACDVTVIYGYEGDRPASAVKDHVSAARAMAQSWDGPASPADR